MTSRPHLTTLIVAVAALAVPASALASAEDVIRDCGQDGALNRQYSDRELREARANLPTDLDEYSDCREVISAAISSGSDGTDAKASGADDKPSAKEQAARVGDQQELDRLTAAHERPADLEVGGQKVTPGDDGLFDVASASNDLPLPLILVLIGLALMSVAGGFLALRSRIPLLSRFSLPSRGPRRRSGR